MKKMAATLGSRLFFFYQKELKNSSKNEKKTLRLPSLGWLCGENGEKGDVESEVQNIAQEELNWYFARLFLCRSEK